ncbi:MAG: Smr/MutS family protein [Rhodomicrobium sp.]
MEGRRSRRFLSKEELELWARVTRRDEPLARALPAAQAEAVPPDRPESAAPREEAPKAQGALQPAKPGIPLRSRHPSPPAPEPFDPRTAKRIARGRREIDARLDLHGLRQQDAYLVLRRFLAQAQALGHRHVLVITGKGASADNEGRREFWTSEERGVLRRLVPHWLCEPAMRLHVVSFTESALQHGGSGALYVTIRKGPRSRG